MLFHHSLLHFLHGGLLIPACAFTTLTYSLSNRFSFPNLYLCISFDFIDWSFCNEMVWAFFLLGKGEGDIGRVRVHWFGALGGVNFIGSGPYVIMIGAQIKPFPTSAIRACI